MTFYLKSHNSLKKLLKSLGNSSLRRIEVEEVEDIRIDSKCMDWVAFRGGEEEMDRSVI